MKKLSQEALKKLKEKLATKNLACIVVKPNGAEIEVAGAGIAPTINLLEQGEFDGAIVLDKIIGRAAAMLMTLGHVCYVHGVVMSQSAVDWLTQKGVPFSYDTVVQYIINRTGAGLCPMEETVKDIRDEKTALEALKRKVEELRANN